jgi:putative sensor protein
MDQTATHNASDRFAPIPRPAVTARDFTYLVLGLPLGIATFTFAVTGLSLAAGLAITLLGIPVLLLTLLAVRGIAWVERGRAAWLLGEPVVGRERRLDGNLWARAKTIAGDPASWRDTVWSLLLLPVGIANFTVAVTLWSASLGFLTSPAWYWALPSDSTTPLLDSTSLGASVLRVLIGLALLPVAAVVCRGLAAGNARLARAILG